MKANHRAVPKDADLNTFEPIISPTKVLLNSFFYVPQKGKNKPMKNNKFLIG